MKLPARPLSVGKLEVERWIQAHSIALHDTLGHLTSCTQASEYAGVCSLTRASPSIFRFAASTKKEWDIEALLRVANSAVETLRPQQLAVAYLPWLGLILSDWDRDSASDLICEQLKSFHCRSVLAVLIDGYDRYESVAQQVIADIARSAEPRHYALVESEYRGFALVAQEVLRHIEWARDQHALPPLRLSNSLSRIAMGHAKDIANRGTMTHVGNDGASLKARLARGAYQCQAAGENLALGTLDASEIVDSWLRSTRHRLNILSPYVDVGVAVAAARGRDDGARLNPTCVGLFATPASNHR